jgi:RNA polymerase sigma factor (sigma-70 family)
MAATALGWRTGPTTTRGRAVGQDDHRLVARVRAGDDAAFETIYDRYARGLLAFCHHMLANREEAEDALQHSLVSAYKMLRSTDGEIELRPWLYAIARNRCLSMLRARRKDISLDGAPERGGAADGLADEVQRRTDLRELMEDLRRLPEDQRGALVLFELGGLPHDEIAAVLRVRREKVKALVFQAREGLMRARRARDLPCTEMRQQLATLHGKVPKRSMLRRHLDRCPSCALFEAEVGRQRAGLALILPVLPTVGLKGIVLGSTLGSGAAVAGGSAGGGGVVLGAAGGGGGAAGLAGAGAGAGAVSGGSIVAGAAAGGASVGVGGTLAAAGSAGTVAAALAAKGAGVSVAKLLAVAVVAVGGGAAQVGNLVTSVTQGGPPPALQDAGTAPVVSPALQQLLGPADPPPIDPAAAAAPAIGHDALAVPASDPTLTPAAASAQTGPVPAADVPPATLGTLPSSGDPSPGPTAAPAAGDTAAAAAPPTTTSETPAPAPSPSPSPSPASPAPAGAAAPAAAPADPASSGTSAPAAAPATASDPVVTQSAPASTSAPAAADPTPADGSPAPGADSTPAPGLTRDPGVTTPADPPPEP